jgi:hypothetical protein
MNEEKRWHWGFRAFESAQEGHPVQDWFDGLPQEVKDEICDLLGYLENMTDRIWKRPGFDPLKPEKFSELRADDVPVETEEGIKTFYCRMYGFFGKGQNRQSFIFLHGTAKEQRNDRQGKRIARQRLAQLNAGKATTHEFEFEG